MLTLIKKITNDLVGQEITLKGWVSQARASGKVAFIELRDGTGFIQCVAEPQFIGDEKFDVIKSLNIESAISVTGIVSKHPKKELFELQIRDIEVYTATKDYPLGQKEHNPDFLFDNRHLYLRSKSQWAILRIRDTIIHATYDWMRDNDFTKIDSPIFTPTCAEDSTELYRVEHTNGEQMFLSQTGQMYIEAAIAGHRNVYDFGPVFRAEKSKTRRHLNELWMMDAEMAFTDFRGNMDIQESLVKYIVAQVLERNTQELEIIGRDTTKLEAVRDREWPRITHVEIVKQLQALGSDIKDGEDLGGDDEEILMNQYETPIFVTNFPLAVKAFYMPEDPEHPGTAKCSDLLAPEGYGEVIGGSERIGDYEILKQKIIDKGYDLEEYQWYLDIRKYGGVTTSGFGFGLERLVRWLCGLHHIRETIPFPRYANRIRP